jgi:hypothetical protein
MKTTNIESRSSDLRPTLALRAWLALPALVLATALSACGTTEPKNMHTGDRILNPNRFPAGAHVRIVEVGEGDKQYDESQSFKGLICTVGKGGIRSDWSDDYYEGVLERCSNGGKSFSFLYVRVAALEVP